MSESERDIRKAIAAVVAGEAEVNDLQIALADIVSEEDVPEVALRAELLVAEYTGGHRTLESLRGQLRPLVAPVHA